MSGVAHQRLCSERKAWRKDHPFGFVARPMMNADGSTNMLRWNCRIPGKAGTIWESGVFPLDLIFNDDYPASPPIAKFPPGFWHVNCYDSGKVCLSIINPPQEKGMWRPSVTVKMVLLGIQELLDNPNIDDPAQLKAYEVYQRDRAKYNRLVRDQAKKYSAGKLSTL